MAVLTPYPIRNRVVDTDRKVTIEWDTWFRDQLASVNAAPFTVAHVFESSLSAAVSAEVIYQTPIRIEAVYHVSYTMRVITPGTVSSSLAFTLGWTAGAATQSEARVAVTGNATTTQQSGIFVIRADARSNITYTTTYASVGATSMAYTLDVLVEQMPDPPS